MMMTIRMKRSVQFLALLGVILLLVLLAQRQVKEGFATVDDSLLHLSIQTNDLPMGALCINGSQCMSKVCKSSLTGLKLMGQSTKKEDIPLAKFGNCATP